MKSLFIIFHKLCYTTSLFDKEGKIYVQPMHRLHFKPGHIGNSFNSIILADACVT